MALVETRSLVTGRQEPLFGPLDIFLDMGEKVAIAGLNGSGKSTLMLHMAGLLPPYSGRVLINGLPVSEYSMRSLAVLRSYAGQFLPVSSSLSVKEFLDLSTYPHDGDGAVTRRLEFVNEFLNLGPLHDRSVSHLSGGELRKVAVARALAQASKLVFLDEPDAFLDPVGVRSLFELLDGYCRQFGHTVVVVTHALTEILGWADKLILCASDRTPAFGPPEVVLREQGTVFFGRTVKVGLSDDGQSHAHIL